MLRPILTTRKSRNTWAHARTRHPGGIDGIPRRTRYARIYFEILSGVPTMNIDVCATMCLYQLISQYDYYTCT